MPNPVDIRTFRTIDRNISALEEAKVALKRHHEHMVQHRAELQGHIDTVDEQIRMVGPALEAIEVQLLAYRGGGITDASKQVWSEPQSEEASALERARMFAAQGRFTLPPYEDLRTGDGDPLPPQDERGKRIDILTQQYLDEMKQ